MLKLWEATVGASSGQPPLNSARSSGTSHGQPSVEAAGAVSLPGSDPGHERANKRKRAAEGTASNVREAPSKRCRQRRLQIALDPSGIVDSDTATFDLKFTLL